MLFSRNLGFLAGLAVAGCLALSACHPPPAPSPKAGGPTAAVQKPSPNDVIQEQRRFDDRGGRGGGF